MLLVVPGYGRGQPQTAASSRSNGQVLTNAVTVDTNSRQAPLVLTLQDSLTRAKANDPQFRAALTELGLAHQDTVQSRAQLLPNVNYNMAFNYTQGNFIANSKTPAPAGRYIANNGVHEYIAQGTSIRRFRQECWLSIAGLKLPRPCRARNPRLQPVALSSPWSRLTTATSWPSANMQPRRRRRPKRTAF